VTGPRAGGAGVLVLDVPRGSPAERAGIKPTVRSFNGVPPPPPSARAPVVGAVLCGVIFNVVACWIFNITYFAK